MANESKDRLQLYGFHWHDSAGKYVTDLMQTTGIHLPSMCTNYSTCQSSTLSCTVDTIVTLMVATPSSMRQKVISKYSNLSTQASGGT